MRTSSCKAKGRRACTEVMETLMQWAPDLQDGDIRVTSSSVTGEDLQLSPRALQEYPYVFECKCVEKLNIWDALTQAVSHLKGRELTPILAFRRNRSDLYVALKIDDFMRLTR